MILTPDTIGKVTHIAEEALRKIGAEKIEKKANLAVKFAIAQAPEEITLDGEQVVAVAVTIATVFSLEGHYYQFADENGVIRSAETIPSLSIVIIGEDVRLCKSTFDVVPGAAGEEDRFFNCRYWTTDLEMLTEKYIC